MQIDSVMFKLTGTSFVAVIFLYEWEELDECYKVLYIHVNSIRVYFYFSNLPYEPPDETSHFFRIYTIGHGDFYPEEQKGELGNMLPTAVIESLSNELDDDERHSYEVMSEQYCTPVDENNLVFVPRATATTSPIL